MFDTASITNQKNWIIALVAVIGLITALLFFGKANTQPIAADLQSDLLKLVDHQQLELTVGGTTHSFELVNTNISRSQGLSGRSEIPYQGMVFAMPNSAVQTFWMKDMLFNLDFIWIEDGVVVAVNRDVAQPAPGSRLEEIPVVRSGKPADVVIELTAGTLDAWGVKVGDSVRLLDRQ